MHDDQHGTAIVVLAALRNAARVVGRPLSDLRVVVGGAGAAGVACTKILLEAGIGDIGVADSKGMLHAGRDGLTPIKQWLVDNTNRAGLAGTLLDAMHGADVYLGLSGGSLPESAIAAMAPGCIVFSLANPIPEVDPEMAAKYAAVVATGRSDLPNQINNVLAFPGVFRGAIDAGARSITEAMKLAAATAIADVVGDEVRADYIVPSPLDRRVADRGGRGRRRVRPPGGRHPLSRCPAGLLHATGSDSGRTVSWAGRAGPAGAVTQSARSVPATMNGPNGTAVFLPPAPVARTTTPTTAPRKNPANAPISRAGHDR